MKQASEAFEIDNGTVYAGQKLPDSHPAVDRFPDNFADVEDIPADVDVTEQATAVPDGTTTTGTGTTKKAQPGGDTSASGSAASSS